MPAELGHGLGVIHDHCSAPKLSAAHVLQTDSSQLYASTVLQAGISLPAFLWVWLPRMELVPATRTMLLWHPDSHRLL